MVITIEVWFDAQLVWGSRVWDKMMFGWIFDNLKAYLPCNNCVIKIYYKFITPKTDPKCDFHGSDRLKTITRHNHAHYETVRASWVMFWENMIFILAESGIRTRPRPLKINLIPHPQSCIKCDILYKKCNRTELFRYWTDFNKFWSFVKLKHCIFDFLTLVLCWRGSFQLGRPNPSIASKNLVKSWNFTVRMVKIITEIMFVECIFAIKHVSMVSKTV